MGKEGKTFQLPAGCKNLATVVASILIFASMTGYPASPDASGNIPEEQKLPITVTAVGDIMMGSRHPTPRMPPCEGRYLFSGVREHLGNSDIVFGNLEGPLTDECNPQKCRNGSTECFEFFTPSTYANHLKEAGFTVLGIANNHAYDCGIEGIENTIGALKASDLKFCGGQNIARFSIRETVVAVVCFSYNSSDHAYSINDPDFTEEIVSELKSENDIVIVSFHGGAEGKRATHIIHNEEFFLGENRGNVVKFARTAIDAGADMVIGHGPHVLRAIEIYNGKLIAYSLGNFLTYKMFNVRGISGISVILSVRLDPLTGNFLGGNITPVKLTSSGIPRIDPEGKAFSVINNLIRSDITEPRATIDENGIIAPHQLPRD